MINCKVCHRTYKTLTGNHLATHNIGVQEYKKRYRLKYLHSREARKKISRANIGNTKTKGKKAKLPFEANKKRSRFWISFNQLPSTRKKRQSQMKGNQNAKGHRHSKAFKSRFSKRIKNLWADPSWRKKMIMAQKSRIILKSRTRSV